MEIGSGICTTNSVTQAYTAPATTESSTFINQCHRKPFTFRLDALKTSTRRTRVVPERLTLCRYQQSPPDNTSFPGRLQMLRKKDPSAAIYRATQFRSWTATVFCWTAEQMFRRGDEASNVRRTPGFRRANKG